MKKLKIFTLFIIVTLFLTGCDLFKIDNMEDISIITTSYPLEYVVRFLYGEHSVVNSVYPDGTDISNFELTDKMIEKYSKEDLFIYVSYGNDTDIAVKLLEKNKKLLIIDGSLGMSPDYKEELWLNPSNLLMVSQNIKTGLTEYLSSSYLIKEIEKKYDELKLKLSELDAEIKLTQENASYKTIVVANKSLNYLKKYGFNVISLDDDNLAIEKSIKDVTTMINNGSIKYIYSLENTEENDKVKTLLENNSSLSVLRLKKLDSITTEERNNKDDYFKLMDYNIEQIKKEAYK